MRCAHCGTEVSAAASACPVCGHPLSASPSPAAPAPPAGNPQGDVLNARTVFGAAPVPPVTGPAGAPPAPATPGTPSQAPPAGGGSVLDAATRVQGMPAAPPPANQGLFAGRYQVLAPLGEGGMARVVRALDTLLGEECALKMMHPQLFQDRRAMDRFLEEARISRRLIHENIVRVHDVGEADGVLYLSMELLQGRSLRQVLNASGGGVPRLPYEQIVAITRDVCRALSHAHQFTIHRDIKPENIFLVPREDGSQRVKLLDFGIAVTAAEGNQVVAGTPRYMAPEQRVPGQRLGPATDLYALGLVIHELIDGQVPTDGRSHLPPGVPRAWHLLVSDLLQPDPARRISSADEVVARLSRGIWTSVRVSSFGVLDTRADDPGAAPPPEPDQPSNDNPWDKGVSW